MSLPPESTPTSTCGMTRRLSLLKKFGGSFVKGISSSGCTAPPAPPPVPAVIDGRTNVGAVQSSRDSSFNGEGKTNMLPPPPQHESGGNLKGFTVGSGNGSNMRKLLEDLHRSRVCFEQDQKALEKARINIEHTERKAADLMSTAIKAKERFQTLAELAAFKRTELNAVEIRNKVISKTLQEVEEELNHVLEELHKIRIETSELSSLYLTQTVQFGLQWNGTELGREFRRQFNQQEFENLERQKRQLEFELADFLVLQKGVEQCEKDVENLSEKYKEHGADMSKQENDLQKRIDELDAALKELEYEESEFLRYSSAETEQLQKQIDDKQSSIAYLQSQSAEAKAASSAETELLQMQIDDQQSSIPPLQKAEAKGTAKTQKNGDKQGLCLGMPSSSGKTFKFKKKLSSGMQADCDKENYALRSQNF